eukprot:TCONS_00045009-protein
MLEKSYYKVIHKLHVMGQLEGLLIILKTDFWKEFDHRRQAIFMDKIKPKISEVNILGKQKDPKLYIEFVMGTLNLRKAASSFVEESDVKFSPTTVIVKNLPFKTKPSELWDYLETFGKVLRVTIPRDRRSKKSKGHGYVVFANPLQAEKVLKLKVTKLQLRGRNLQVFPANRTKDSMYSASKKFKRLVQEFVETDEKHIEQNLEK